MNILLACVLWIIVGTTNAFTHVTTGWSEDTWGHGCIVQYVVGFY